MEEKKVVDELLDIFNNLKEDDWKIKVNSLSTIREVLVHLIGWQQEYIVDLMDVLKSKKKPWFMTANNFDEFNKSSQKYYKNYSIEELIERFQNFIRVFNDEIKDLGEEDLKDRKELFSWVFDFSHFKLHLDQIKEALRKNGKIIQ